MGVDDISDKLDDINETLENLVKVIDKPNSPIHNVLTIAGAVVTTLGIIEVIDIFLKWF